MKMFQTEAEIAADGGLVLHELPFAPGERVAVTVTAPAAFSEMRAYAERFGAASGEFVEETQSLVTDRCSAIRYGERRYLLRGPTATIRLRARWAPTMHCCVVGCNQ